MTVRQLIDIINLYPDDMNVYVEFYDGWEEYLSKEIDVSEDYEYIGCYSTDKTCLHITGSKEY